MAYEHHEHHEHYHRPLHDDVPIFRSPPPDEEQNDSRPWFVKFIGMLVTLVVLAACVVGVAFALGLGAHAIWEFFLYGWKIL